MRLATLALCFAAACSGSTTVCGELTSALQQCGFPVTDLQCDGVSRAELEDLVRRFGERDCSGFAGGDRAVDPRLCALGGWACPASPTPEADPRRPKYPLVFVSGIDGSPALDWNPAIVAALGQAGIAAHHLQVLPWATTPERARDLSLSLHSLRRHLDDSPVNLICYAVGGLDCRYLVSPGGLNEGDGVASVTTMATPHRGTRVAEAARSALLSGTVTDILQALVGSGTKVTIPDDARLLQTLDGLSPSALKELNPHLPDAPGVQYFSWAGISHLNGRSSTATEESIRAHCASPDGTLLFQRHPDTRDALNPILWATVPFSFDVENEAGRFEQSPSDGMVSVESAKWGRFEGCLPADHYDLVGEIGHTTRDPRTGFDAPRFYRFVAGQLAARGL